jgi:hypothetical protein
MSRREALDPTAVTIDERFPPVVVFMACTRRGEIMNTPQQRVAVSAGISISLVALTLLSSGCRTAGTWGLLATPGYENQPPKGVYFFAGDPIAQGLFTSDSEKRGRDYAWTNSTKVGSDARDQIVTEIRDLGANVIFTPYYGDFQQFLFLNNSKKAFMDIFYASRNVNGPLIVPSLETANKDGQPVFDTVRDISPLGETAINWVTDLVKTIVDGGVQNKWAQIYDRNGVARYAIQISEAGSLAPKCPRDSNNIEACNAEADRRYVQSLEDLQAQVQLRTGGQRDGRTGVITGGILIGFVLTPVESVFHYSIIQSNPDRLPILTDCNSCLAILPYFTELPRTFQECVAYAPDDFRGFIDCDRAGRIDNLARFKKDRTKLWVNSGTPYYLDLDSGYDAHLVFNERTPGKSVNSVWGETYDYYDPWRNSQSELKGHQGDGNKAPSGVVYNSWNGYTEVSVAVDSSHHAWDPNRLVPACAEKRPPDFHCEKIGEEPLGMPYPWTLRDGSVWLVEWDFKDLRRTWLRDVFSVDPRLCDHYYYENHQRKFHLYGAICEKFTEKYGEYGPLGAPTSNPYQLGNRTVEDFRGGRIYWNWQGAHEVHGGIYARYNTLLQNGRNLGAPITDETATPNGDGFYNHFEFGSIYWTETTHGIGIWGNFRDRWATLGWERGRLAYPRLEPTRSQGAVGWFAQFQGGNMYAISENSPAWEVWGSILAEYGRLGWERSWLGYPITGEGDSGFWCSKGKFNRFEHGYIDWCEGKNACAHHGDGHCDDGRARPDL